MKRFLPLLLVLVCVVSWSCAGAGSIGRLRMEYDSAAYVFGAPEISGHQMVQNGSIYTFNLGPLMIGFDFNDDGSVKRSAIYAKDDSCAADFLSSCMAMIYCLGDIDYTAFGMMLQQFTDIRNGKETMFYNIGKDVFQVLAGDTHKYCFVYLNNDQKTSY